MYICLYVCVFVGISTTYYAYVPDAACGLLRIPLPFGKASRRLAESDLDGSPVNHRKLEATFLAIPGGKKWFQQ